MKIEAPNMAPREDNPEYAGFSLDGRIVKWSEVTAALLEYALKEKAIDKEQHYQLLRRYGEARDHDDLTKLLNFRSYEAIVNQLITKLGYNMDAILVVAVDLNEFKRFNEKPYTHAVGDKALKAMAEKMRQVAHRQGDLIFRRSGDEFIFVFPIRHGDDEDMEALYERVQRDVNRGLHVLAPDEQLSLLIRANFGHAVVRKGENKTAKELYDEADAKEREAKPEKK